VAIEVMAQTTIAQKSMHFSDFANIMALIDMDFDALYRTYVGKNVLNFFRQDHGYKDGSYIKIWADREEQPLSRLISACKISSGDSVAAELYSYSSGMALMIDIMGSTGYLNG
jgi:hypothetical protein